MWIYILTFLLAIVIDFLPSKSGFVARKLLMLWLYVFLCFGYTVGTDWRNYEDLYNLATTDELLNRLYEHGFYYLVYISRKLSPDFWLFVGIMKCIYLYVVIRFIRRFTNKIFIVVAILLNYNLLFMLVDNPLRFMTASIILVYSIDAIILKKYKRLLFLGIIASFFHIAILFSFLVVFSIRYFKNIIYWSTGKLVYLYVGFCLLGALPNFLNSFSSFIASYVPFLATKLENTYYVSSIDPMFTIGSLIMVLMFILVIKYRSIILSSYHGDILFYYTLVYLYLFRLLIIVPTGFRINVFFSIFFVISIVIIISYTKSLLRLGVFVLLIITISKSIWESYQYLPYTNSIYYIFTQDHLPRSYRENLNKDEYYQRTGKHVEEKKFKLKN